MSADPADAMLATAPGLETARATIDSYAKSHLPVLVRGEVTTARAVIPRLTVEGMAAPIELFCRLGDGDGAIRPALAQQRDRLRLPGLLVLLEVGGLGARDHEHLMQIARHGVIDMSGTPIHRRVVCQLDPRVETLKVSPGAFLEVDLPSLEARPGDALWLFEQLLASQLGGEHRLGANASEAIAEHAWPGDVPELLGLVERLVARARLDLMPGVLGVDDLSLRVVSDRLRQRAIATTEGGRSLREMMDEYEAELIRATMARVKGNKSQAARQLGISRSYLIQKCDAYGVD